MYKILTLLLLVLLCTCLKAQDTLVFVNNKNGQVIKYPPKYYSGKIKIDGHKNKRFLVTGYLDSLIFYNNYTFSPWKNLFNNEIKTIYRKPNVSIEKKDSLVKEHMYTVADSVNINDIIWVKINNRDRADMKRFFFVYDRVALACIGAMIVSPISQSIVIVGIVYSAAIGLAIYDIIIANKKYHLRKKWSIVGNRARPKTESK